MPPYDRRVQGAARIIKIAGEDVGAVRADHKGVAEGGGSIDLRIGPERTFRF
jgi:hypothetical protein